jgi:hypothetical protein
MHHSQICEFPASARRKSEALRAHRDKARPQDENTAGDHFFLEPDLFPTTGFSLFDIMRPFP